MKQPESGLVIAGKYRLERALASGGMGSVWIARHIGLDVEVAIKFMASAVEKEAQMRFEREAKAAARIQSPHVVHVQDYGVDDDLPYIVMELLHGEDLGTRLKRQQRLSLEQAFTILVQTGKALRRTHDEGIVHRDLKPGNIFLVRGDDDDDIVKIVDFGIAKGTGPFISDDMTQTGSVMGSPSYMSPEQVRGAKDIDARSDLWSLGVILYRAITGRLPFVSEVPSYIFVMIVTETAAPPTSIVPDLPEAIDGFFARALARERSERFQSVREMVEAFARVIGRPSFPRFSSESMPGSAMSDRGASSGQIPLSTLNPSARPSAAPASIPANSVAPALTSSSPSSTEGTLTKPITMDTRSSSAPGRTTRWTRVGAGVLAVAVAGGTALFLRANSKSSDAGANGSSAPTDSPSTTEAALPPKESSSAVATTSLTSSAAPEQPSTASTADSQASGEASRPTGPTVPSGGTATARRPEKQGAADVSGGSGSGASGPPLPKPLAGSSPTPPAPTTSASTHGVSLPEPTGPKPPPPETPPPPQAPTATPTSAQPVKETNRFGIEDE